MRKAPIKSIKAGMELARPVYGINGEILLNRNTELKPNYLTLLKNMGVSSVYIKDERLEDVDQSDVIADRTRHEAHSLIKKMFTETAKGGSKAKEFAKLGRNLNEIVKNIIDDLLSNSKLVINLHDIKSTDTYYFEHSLSVTVLSIIMSLKMEMPVSMIKRNTGGMLLFDIGNIFIPHNILQKNEPLTSEEFDVIKTHPNKGFFLLNKTEIIPESARQIVRQHHERIDGEGYPNKLTGKKMNIMSQIVAVADVYDALISERPYRPAFHPFQALELLSGMVEGLNIDAVRALFKSVSAFPVGMHVAFNTGESGLVIGNTPGSPFRPKVRIFYEGKDLSPIANPYELDLADNLDVVITKVIKENEEIEVSLKPFFEKGHEETNCKENETPQPNLHV